MKRLLRDFQKTMDKEVNETYSEEDRDDLNEMQYDISIMIQDYIDKQEKCIPLITKHCVSMN